MNIIVIFALISTLDHSTVRYFDNITDCNELSYRSPHTECVVVKIDNENFLGGKDEKSLR
jgi:hypothetical protein